ncbi:MAG: 5-(carboxyamino)imidazole ribonucleotide mutase [Candidatus Caldatribacteriota bacterium]|nr:5-(carboxyamino)imidazole ribonucleotide mutase [Atribacterota bacterium]MDD3640262.1 5-(carboxyamino)imidazole ribonucleotide mutase [Atribacterota bacterium]MDD4288969.1 5-(carboxyamino)imidazole ribonucleotide mutase [Atribacterota bacterium]MDD4765355.1 5-(carboxyamino)imidazole ribonucleotide mutase [Atribacterota bacterium]MDD5635676.1 5-(carboxyamino)imidazole ribonucleotide mutase [Atribacterota bacterium]
MDISIIMGSTSDQSIMEKATEVLQELGISYELRAISAHRTPDFLFQYINQFPKRGFKVVIAGAGGAAHLPGVIAAKTLLPVIGVPVKTQTLDGLDSLLSIVQMPKGVPVATVGINNAANAALLAARIMALENNLLKDKLTAYVQKMEENIINLEINKGIQ